jgi:hypothetical protein
MRNKLWLTEDIRNGLIAVYAAHAAALAEDGRLEARPYKRGFATALASVALAFGIAVPDEIAKCASKLPTDEPAGQQLEQVRLMTSAKVHS